MNGLLVMPECAFGPEELLLLFGPVALLKAEEGEKKNLEKNLRYVLKWENKQKIGNIKKKKTRICCSAAAMAAMGSTASKKDKNVYL